MLPASDQLVSCLTYRSLRENCHHLRLCHTEAAEESNRFPEQLIGGAAIVLVQLQHLEKQSSWKRRNHCVLFHITFAKAFGKVTRHKSIEKLNAIGFASIVSKLMK